MLKYVGALDIISSAETILGLQLQNAAWLVLNAAGGGTMVDADASYRMNDFRFDDFDLGKLQNTIRSLSGAKSQIALTQTEYLGDYLKKCKTKVMVVEGHYIDRYYMKEFSSYYSTCFRCLRNYASRIHYFADTPESKITKETIRKVINDSTPENLATTIRILRDHYVGYSTVRPIAAVPVGRTVLNPYKYLPNKERKYPAIRDYDVHFFGLKFSFKGLAFQQQDQGVGACATTAIWCALQKACNNDGMRPPTSPEITEAATQYFIPGGREYPSSGLTVEQCCEAIRSFALAPHILDAEDLFEFFKACVYTYLVSGIPVILSLRRPDQEFGHAVTLVGFRLSGKDATSAAKHLSMQRGGGKTLKIRCVGSQLNKVYIHDDRLGPYSRAEFGTLKEKDKNKKTRLSLSITMPGANKIPDRWVVENAIVPLYPKLRTCALGIIDFSAAVIPAIAEFCAGGKTDGLAIEARFKKGGDYLQWLHEQGVEQRHELINRISLPRYVGYLRVYLKSDLLCDFLIDTTDAHRARYCPLCGVDGFEEPKSDIGEILDNPLLAVVNYQPAFSNVFKTLGELLGILTNVG